MDGEKVPKLPDFMAQLVRLALVATLRSLSKKEYTSEEEKTCTYVYTCTQYTHTIQGNAIQSHYINSYYDNIYDKISSNKPLHITLLLVIVTISIEA